MGTVVEESLKDSRFLNTLNIQSVRISGADNPNERWHLYRVEISESQLNELAQQLKPNKWYAHFWDKQTIYVVFPGKIFEMDRQDKSSWQSAIDYGLNIDIPL